MASYQFAPNRNAPFEFQPILDGLQYNAVVTWNVFGRRFYVSIYRSNGALVLSRPVVGSPLDADISLTAGYFASTMVYREPTNAFEVSP